MGASIPNYSRIRQMPKLCMSRDKGFTLTELLVVIAIVVVLGALLVPAVLQLRVRSGQVIDKEHIDSHTEINTVIDADGNPHIDIDHIDERWSLTIKGREGIRYLGVSEYQYNNTRVGDYVKIEDGIPVKIGAEE